MLLAAVPPNVTAGFVRNPVPVIVTDVPPLVLPEAGEIAVTVGGGLVTLPAPLKARASMTQYPAVLKLELTVYEPTFVTAPSSTISSAEVSRRLVNPPPAAEVLVSTVF